MGIPAESMRVSLVGHQGADEIFDTSFWVAGAGVPTSNADANTYASQVSAQLGGPTLTELCTLLYTDSGYDEVRVYSYPTGGPSASYIGTAAIGSGTGTGTSAMPLQQCMVATLRTGLAGRSHRGRMYLPASGRGLDTGHVFNSTVTSAVCTALADFLSAVNGLGSTNNVAVVSQTLTQATTVVEVTVDQRPDIQRRRANRQSTGTMASEAVTIP